MSLYLEDLQEIVRGGCQTPNCDHKHDTLVVVGRCHPKAGIYAVVVVKDAVLSLRCTECRASVGNIRIASRTPKLEWTPEQLAKFKKDYANAIKAKQDTFEFAGASILTTYAKYLIAHLEQQADSNNGKKGKSRE